MKQCSIRDCQAKYLCRGYCSRHYQNLKRYGDPIKSKVQERHGMRYTPEYRHWSSIKNRCFSKTHIHYKHYGGRGITMCEKWAKSFTAFYNDVGSRPPGLTLDRINNNGNYEPGNVRWATMKVQNNNRRPRRAWKLETR